MGFQLQILCKKKESKIEGKGGYRAHRGGDALASQVFKIEPQESI